MSLIKSKSSERSFGPKKKNHLFNAAFDLKVLFDTYFKKPLKKEVVEHKKPTNEEESQMVVCSGSDEVRNKYLFDVFTQVNTIVKNKQKRKKRLLREAKRLQKETDEQVSLLREISRLESDYEQ